ncbi:DUF6701 domain-containing protein [Ideonella sp. DXS22W]|uniref:DUF6701 domain-containing protein n=1 Tax=Pseudaquabacterium inlustre TaxID=2984192 RepID=A0ABU9CFC9_9BURK
MCSEGRGHQAVRALGLALALWLAGGWATVARAAITEVVWGTFATSSGGPVTSATVPTRGIGATLATGDVGVAVLSLRNTLSITPPAGWTLLADHSDGLGGRTWVYLRIITNPSTEPQFHTWTFPPSYLVASGILLRGVDTASPLHTSATWGDATSGSAVTLPGITTTTSGVLQLGVAVVANAPASFTPPAGMSERADAASNSTSVGISHTMLTQLEGTAGSLSAARTVNASRSGARTGILVGLNPAPPAPTLHHIELRHGSGQSVTCMPATLTVAACANASCTSLYTGGVNGVLTASGTGMTVNWPDGASFDIPAGSGTVTRRMHQTTAGTTTVGVQYANPAAVCTFGSPTCSWTASSSGFVFDVPDHRAGQTQSVQISALSAASNTSCAPALAGATRSVVLRCTPQNPASGSRAVTVGGAALNAGNNAQASCDAGGRSLSLSFDANGQASLAVAYADAGRVALSATYTGSTANGDNGLVLSGTDSFTAAPTSFQVVPSAGPLRAGGSFSATVTALNAAGTAMPNFGRESPAETVSLGFVRIQPTGSGASDGSFSGTRTLGGFTSGAATASDLSWSEVGRGDLVARLVNSSYLGAGVRPAGSSAGSGATVCAAEGGSCTVPGGGTGTVYFGSASGWVARPGSSGSVACTSAALGQPAADADRGCIAVATSGSATGSVGDFIPSHVDLTASAACGSFSYAGQPVSLTLTARNAAGGVTLNFDGSGNTTPSFAQAFGLAEAGALGLGSLTAASVPATAFAAGVASASASYAFTQKTTAPQTLTLRASNGASGAAAISSSGQAEPALALRSGRLRLSNAFGSARAALQVPLSLEYWSGQAWLVNSADTCTTLPMAAVGLSRPRDALGQASTASTTVSGVGLTAGRGALTLSAPSPAGRTLTVDIALNLGTLSADQACQGSQPPTTGAGVPWLRSHNGACAATADRDPAGRASFGIHSPETRRLVHVRDLH